MLKVKIIEKLDFLIEFEISITKFKYLFYFWLVDQAIYSGLLKQRLDIDCIK